MRRRQLGRARGRDLPAGVDGKQVRDVAVGVLRGVEHRVVGLFVQPFQQLPPAANARAGQAVTQTLGGALEVFSPQHLGRARRGVEQLPQDLLVVADAILHGAVLGRPTARGDQSSIGQGPVVSQNCAASFSTG